MRQLSIALCFPKRRQRTTTKLIESLHVELALSMRRGWLIDAALQVSRSQ